MPVATIYPAVMWPRDRCGRFAAIEQAAPD
jgi:hypothetical protein